MPPACVCRLINLSGIPVDMSTLTTTWHRRRLESVEGFLLLGMPAAALRELDALRRGGLDNSVVCRVRAEALRDLKRYEEALREYERFEAGHPDDLTTLMGMAWCLKRIDRLDDAVETMHRAYRTHPDEPVVLYNIACYLTLAGEKTQALSWLGRALRMQPKFRELIARERDFDNLRQDPDFQFVIADPRKPDDES
jgi:tetratricopeptide (TPR) repeat protein